MAERDRCCDDGWHAAGQVLDARWPWQSAPAAATTAPDASVAAADDDVTRADGEGRYDFVIVGGGSAGCALANRLSADPATSVLVLEAGRRDWRFDVCIHMPAALSFPIGNRFYDWQYASEPEPHMGGRRIYHARGKVLGGSSSINGMIFQRGNPLDYERWAADEGMERWDYAHCLPYFKRMESCLAGDDHSVPGDGASGGRRGSARGSSGRGETSGEGVYRGHAGPLVLERGPAANPLFEAFLAAAEQAGHPRTADVNGYRQEGFAAFDRNVHRGRRLSASQAYLHPALDRPNLRLVTRAFTTKVLFEGDRATGVAYTKGGRRRTVRASEVICCGGAINSPQLLQLSGVGPAGLLHRHGIDVVADVPAVGANLQDHLEVYVQHACKQPVSMQPHLAKWRRPWIGLQWLVRRGPGATNHFEAGGFIRSNDDAAYPNLMFHFLPVAVRYDGSAPTGGHGYQVHVGPMYSDSRGTVAIVSDDPRVKPALRFNYLSTDQDRREWVEAVRHARHILSQPAMDPFNGGEVSPGPGVGTDAEILDWVRRDAETALHPSCTARMGLGDDSALHPDSLEVHGTRGLRVVDASSMPYVTNGNIYAPVMMLAEKAADLILGNTPPPPEPVDFHRAGATGVT